HSASVEKGTMSKCGYYWYVGFINRLQRNIVVGDNEAGKSTILTAIELVLSGSRSKVESLGVEALR
ncbi:AAA family ATPase, partial [Shewanella sp.]|uniref:AAA family ATPase n=1 Tax=Shewanella sp. TaxID=50422 RepID=UPI003A968C37